MLSAVRGSTKVTVLTIVLLVALAGIGYLILGSGDSDSQILRTVHCKACNRDFEVDLNTLGPGKLTCRYCSSPDVVLVEPSE